MLTQTTTRLDQTLETAQPAVYFWPLVDLSAGATVLAPQSYLTLSGVAAPVELRLVACPLGTPAGAPPPVLTRGPLSSWGGPAPHQTLDALLPALGHIQDATIGLVLRTGTLPAGTRVQGALVTLRGVAL